MKFADHARLVVRRGETSARSAVHTARPAISGAISYRVAWWLFVPFTIARILHTAAYSLGLQPWRSIFFGIGDLSLFVTTAMLLRAAI